MKKLKTTPYRSRWMLATTILSAVSATMCYIGQFVRVWVNDYYDRLLDQQSAANPGLSLFDLPAYKLQLQFNDEFTYWMLIPIFTAFLSVLLFMVVAIRDQYRLTPLRGAIAYLLIALSIAVSGCTYLTALANDSLADAATALLYTFPFLMIPVLFVALLFLNISGGVVTLPSMFSPYIGIPLFLNLFTLCFGPFAGGNYDVYDPGGIVETWMMTIFMGLTVLLMIFDTVRYRHALFKAQDAA